LSHTVAVQGELGSNSELAAHAYFHDSELSILPCHDFDELFRAVRNGDADYGMAPVDNSLAGSIHEVWDLLVSDPLPIAGEIFLHVRHFLIARPGARMDEIRRIYSHEQALAQCQTFLGSLNGAQSEIVYDTAGAVAMVKDEGSDADAAIAPAQAARDHGMQILAEDIQSDDENYTRFLVLGTVPNAAAQGDQKSTIVIRLGDSARTLAAALSVITERGIELEKVESRKLVGQAWEYVCYLEIRGSLEDPQVAAALKELHKLVLDLWVIGSYRSGTRAEPPVIDR
jgi:prephenate dehydratase